MNLSVSLASLASGFCRRILLDIAMPFDELQKVFRDVAREARKSNDIASLLRAQLPVYLV